MKPFLTAVLFDASGTTQVAQLAFSFNKRFVDELRGEGSFSLTVPWEEGGNITLGKIIKFSYGESSDDYVFAGVVENIKRTHTDTDNVYEISGRGVRSILESAIIFDSDKSYTSKTVGYIMAELFDAAKVRGALDGLTRTFTDTLDSGSQSFTANETLTIDEKFGSNLGEVANRHAELAVDVWVKPDMTVNYYIERGTDTTESANPTVLRVGESVVSYEKTTEGPVKNVALASYGQSSTVTATSAGSISEYGRQETYLSLSNIPDATTAGLAVSKTLDNLDEPSVGATVELTDDGPVPYIDFQIGDWLYVTDELGNRDKFRVRSVSLAEEANGGVRIIPELGNVKAALEERLRRLIARQEAKTASGAADASAASVDLNGVGIVEGGGTAVNDAEVLTYDPTTGLGTADAPLIDVDPIDFTNATNTYLTPGDEIVITTFDHDNNPATPDLYVAVGITARSGTITPVNQPVGTISTGFPLQTNTLPNPFMTARGQARNAVYDTAGLLGQGADAIVGANWLGTPTGLSGFSRNTASSFDLGATPISPSRSPFLFSDGRIFLTDESNAYTRNPATGVWTNVFSTTSDIEDVAYDHSNNTIWIYSAGSTAPAGGPFWSMTASDATPVARGALGTGLTVGTTDTSVRMLAGAGKLVMQHNDIETTGYRFYRKNSNDAANFTYSNITTNYLVLNQGTLDNRQQVVTATDLWYLTTYAASTPDEVAINRYNYATGTITTYLTGIVAEGSPVGAKGYTITASGVHVILCVRNDGTANRISLATSNLTSTNYVFTDTARNSISIYDIIGVPFEVSPNVIRFSIGENPGSIGNLSGAWEYEVSLS